MKKIKKYSFWTGLSAAVVILVNALGKAFGFSIDNQIVEEIIMAICGVLVALGIVCLPVNTKQEDDISSNDENKSEQVDNQENNQDINKDNEI